MPPVESKPLAPPERPPEMPLLPRPPAEAAPVLPSSSKIEMCEGLGGEDEREGARARCKVAADMRSAAAAEAAG